MANDVIDTLIAEAIGEGRQGLEAVAWVIKNRAEDRGLTPAQIVRQTSQFTGFSNPGAAVKKAQQDPKIRAQVEAIWKAVQAGAVPDPTGGATHYHTTDVNPSWAKGVNRFGTERIGSHVFYPEHPIPPRDVPQVATLTDTVRRAPAPVTASPDMQLMRGTMGNAAPRVPLPPMGTPRVADLYAGIYPKGDITAPGAVGRSVDVAGRATNPALADALARRVSASPMPGRSGFAGQERAPTTQRTFPTPGQVENTRQPASLPPLPPSSLPTNRVATNSASDRVRGNPNQRTVSVKTVATIPTTGVGKPPATRMVQSVPMPAATKPKPSIARVAGFAGPANVPLPSTPKPIAAPPAPMTASDRVRAAKTAPVPDRLKPTPAIPGPGDLHTAKFTDTTAKVRTGQVDQFGRPVFAAAPVTAPAKIRTAAAPVPLPTINRPAVATQLSVTAPRTLPAPMAFAAPLTGPKIVAPAPMPRLQRPGLPLPGMLGAVSRVMANSSGPFTNGAENAMYNQLRGGDFNTPGAATRQAGGFLYAPNGQGGYVNVGRVDRGMSAADRYAQLNAGNSGPMNTADRMKAASSSSGGDGGVQPKGTIW